ncbi:ATP-binding cassette domain-containing protein [Streptomyces sp. 3MP-14]|uniref:ATP-binding cassette domain-containing protein n=1 Tax=Streptomyces mimosae TaxID=2586635 RepID=A0A5N6AP46_9ACTN|nr:MULTISPECIES: ATP-binding cassette domain-containing protein [Streptomyces]KAB8169873.1 ATP-binding cassette domain-containing protein [Streptomyces mimosae]KAB8178621.1 ATP-binding cassette domain-containing protein [Streptomyces sp. 3MP-14]
MTEDAPLLSARGLVREFTSRGGGPLARRRVLRAVDGVDLDVRAGETLALVGESGSGKSTTARLAARLLDPTEGTVSYQGEDVTRLTGAALHHFRSQVQVVFQDPFSSLNPRHTVERIVTAPLRYQRRPVPGGARAFTRALMERVGLNPDHSGRHPAQFSGGQAQRIGIARALAVGPRIVVCDEAVSALDVSVQARVINLLRRLQREEGLGYLFIAHDLAVVRQIADRVAVLHHGRVVESGDRDSLFAAPRHAYTRTLLAAVPRIRPEWEAARRARAAERAAATPPEEESR